MSYKIEAIDKSKAEGDAGLTTFTFKISRDHAADPTGEFERVMLKLDTPDIDAFDGFSL